MFEVTSRDGVARAGVFKPAGLDVSVTTPSVLFAVTERLPPFEGADAYISDELFDTDKLLLLEPEKGAWGEGALGGFGGAAGGTRGARAKKKGAAVAPNVAYTLIRRAIIYPPSQEPLQRAAVEALAKEAAGAAGHEDEDNETEDNRGSGDNGSPGATQTREEFQFFISQGNPIYMDAEAQIYKGDTDFAGAGVIVLGNARRLFENPREFAKAVMKLRETAGYGRLVYAPGLGEPRHMAVLAYCGVDLFDSIPLVRAARSGVFLSRDGAHHIRELHESACSCPACLASFGALRNRIDEEMWRDEDGTPQGDGQGEEEEGESGLETDSPLDKEFLDEEDVTVPGGRAGDGAFGGGDRAAGANSPDAAVAPLLGEAGKSMPLRSKRMIRTASAGADAQMGFDALLAHNYYSARNESAAVRNAIKNGTLRDLAEMRAASDARCMALLRAVDAYHYGFMEVHAPIVRSSLLAVSSESLDRPDVLRWQERIRTRYRKPQCAKILLLLPCSAKKPYSMSRSYHLFREAIIKSGNSNLFHDVIVTSPLGLVPRDVELVYPAQHYDTPVIGKWYGNEKEMIERALIDFLSKNKYDEIVVHLSKETEMIKGALSGCGVPYVLTGGDNPASRTALLSLEKALSAISKRYEKVQRKARLEADFECFARLQFGEAGSKLVEGAEIRGRYPNNMVRKGGGLVAVVHGGRGQIYPTIEGGRILSGAGCDYCVEIGDFTPQGNVFAGGITGASQEIRVGDEVVAVHAGDVRGVGRALMCGREMLSSKRGAAIKIRQHKSTKHQNAAK